MRLTPLLILLLFALFPKTSTASDFSIETMAGQSGPEKYLMILPAALERGSAYPVLIAPADKDPKGPMFFWGQTPRTHGWVIVQSSHVYNGSHTQLEQVLIDVTGKLETFGAKVEGFHIIGWSANSAKASSHAASLKGMFQSLSLIPGYAGQSTVRQLCSQPSLKLLFITGSRDKSWLSGAKRMRSALERCGTNSIRFEVIEDGGHVLTEIAGTRLFNLLNQNRK